MSSLVQFHRVLIASGILFCAGFSAWELLRWRDSGAMLDLALGLAFALGAGLLLLYLLQLRRVLNLPDSKN